MWLGAGVEDDPGDPCEVTDTYAGIPPDVAAAAAAQIVIVAATDAGANTVVDVASACAGIAGADVVETRVQFGDQSAVTLDASADVVVGSLTLSALSNTTVNRPVQFVTGNVRANDSNTGSVTIALNNIQRIGGLLNVSSNAAPDGFNFSMSLLK